MSQRWIDQVKSYVLFEQWALIDPDDMRQRRAAWPNWRQRLRAVGATVWWFGVVVGTFVPGVHSAHAWSPLFVVGLIATSTLSVCIVLGIGLEWRDRRREGLRIVGNSPPRRSRSHVYPQPPDSG